MAARFARQGMAYSATRAANKIHAIEVPFLSALCRKIGAGFYCWQPLGLRLRLASRASNEKAPARRTERGVVPSGGGFLRVELLQLLEGTKTLAEEALVMDDNRLKERCKDNNAFFRRCPR